MDFSRDFDGWLREALRDGVPSEVVALSFNLFEPAHIQGVKFGVELVGAKVFDATNSDWACEEVWEPKERRLHIPIEFSGQEWETCLAKVKLLVGSSLAKADVVSTGLNGLQGVAVGFVDGDLDVIWPTDGLRPL